MKRRRAQRSGLLDRSGIFFVAGESSSRGLVRGTSTRSSKRLKSAVRGLVRSGVRKPTRQQIVEACTKNPAVGLDSDDLRRALQCRGLYATREQMKEALQATKLHFPVPAHGVAAVAAHLEAAGCDRGLEALPSAWRGVKLSQLKDVHAYFVESGWLLRMCSAAMEAGGEPFPLTENLYSLDRFFIRPITDPDPSARRQMPSGALVEARIPPPFHYACSYSQLLNPNGLDVHLFVSHYWGHPFRKTVASLEIYACDIYQSLGKEWPGDVVFWICLFALNQHRVLDELGECPMAAPFNIALMKAQLGVVMVLDQKAEPLSRIWCLFEVARASDLGQPLRLLTEKGVAGDQNKPGARCLSEQLAERLRTISAYEAKASSEADKMAIWFRIANTAWGKRAGDLEVFRKWIERPFGKDSTMDKGVFSVFDERVRELLATPLFRQSLAEKAGAAALKYIGMGAKFAVCDLQSLESMGIGMDVDINIHLVGVDGVVTLPWICARAGRHEELAYILDHNGHLERKGFFANARTHSQVIHDQTTPLTIACWLGHLEAVRVLLDRRASVHEVSSSGKTALTYTCGMMGEGDNKLEIMRLLLENQAAVDKEHEVTSTPLHWAVGSEVFEAMTLLIEKRASVHLRDDEGATPLHVASLHGLCRSAAFLLAQRADVEARKKDGNHPLQRAALGGHTDLITLLLNEGAMVCSRNDAGQTALDVAQAAGNEEAAELLRRRSPAKAVHTGHPVLSLAMSSAPAPFLKTARWQEYLSANVAMAESA